MGGAGARPYGRRLYVTGSDRAPGAASTAEQTSIGLHVLDVNSGVKVASEDVPAAGIWAAPDPQQVHVHVADTAGRAIEVREAASLDLVRRLPLPEADVFFTRRLDGQPIVLAHFWPDQSQVSAQGPNRLAVLDPTSLNPIREWTIAGYASWITPRTHSPPDSSGG